MRILICLSALLCNLISLKLHTNVKRWVSYNRPAYMRSNPSLMSFIVLSLGIGIIATCGLTTLSWYWNIPIYLAGMFVLALISDMITEGNTRFHMLFILGNRPWGVYIWGLMILSLILAIYGYSLECCLLYTSPSPRD